MKNATKEHTEKQAEIPMNAEAFREMLRGMAREALKGLIAEEVATLCGPAWHPEESSLHQRAGSAPSSVYFEGRKESMLRPRVRKHTPGEESIEVYLETWKLAKDPEEWEDAMMRAVLCGVSTRKGKRLRAHEVGGESKSSLSRLWQRRAAELVEELQTADLSDYDQLVLMVDGVVLAEGLTVIVALGINTHGEKAILGFQVGSSENEQVCTDLLNRLHERGLKEPEGRALLAVLDGSKALKNAVVKRYGNVIVQRCLVHKERNIRGYLSKQDWKALSGHFNRLRKAQGEAAALEATEALEAFLGTRNGQARESYEEAGEELLALHRLNVTNLLNTSLLSTNSIENAFKNLRRHIGRVCRWRKNTNQADLWVASGLILAQHGFRKIRGYREIPELIRALEMALNEKEAA